MCASAAVKLALFVLTLALPGCAGLDSLLLPDPATGRSLAVDAIGGAAPFMEGVWGEIALGAALLAQNVYLAFRKQQTRKAKSQ